MWPCAGWPGCLCPHKLLSSRGHRSVQWVTVQWKVWGTSRGDDLFCSTMYYRSHSLNNRNFFSLSWEGWEVQVQGAGKVYVILRPLLLAWRQQQSHCVLTWPALCVCEQREKGSELSGVSSCKDTNPIRLGTHLWPLVTLITATRELGLEQMNCGGTQVFHPHSEG